MDKSADIKHLLQEQMNPNKDYNNSPKEFYFCLKPVKNPIYNLIEDLRNYRVNLKDLQQELETRKITEIPSQLKQLKIIIEYTDCII